MRKIIMMSLIASLCSISNTASAGIFDFFKSKATNLTDEQKTCIKGHKGECKTKCKIPELTTEQKTCLKSCRDEYKAKGEQPKGACASKCVENKKTNEQKTCMKTCRQDLAKTCNINSDNDLEDDNE